MCSEHKKTLMRQDITYIEGVSMENAVESVKKNLFIDHERETVERIVCSQNDFKEAYEGLIKYRNYENCLAQMHASTGRETFVYKGNCVVCNSPHPFVVDYRFAEESDGMKKPNWRERLVCPNCRCNSRQRFSIGKIFEAYTTGMQIGLYEKETDVFQKVQREIPDVYGFECGKFESEDSVCEEVTELSFANDSFDLLVANDVFEHVENYTEALQEACRVLKNGGKIIITVPFDGNSNVTVNRGSAEHVYQIFGWDFLDKLKQCGFREAYGKVYYGINEGYLGYLPIFFEAYKKDN